MAVKPLTILYIPTLIGAGHPFYISHVGNLSANEVRKNSGVGLIGQGIATPVIFFENFFVIVLNAISDQHDGLATVSTWKRTSCINEAKRSKDRTLLVLPVLLK